MNKTLPLRPRYFVLLSVVGISACGGSPAPSPTSATPAASASAKPAPKAAPSASTAPTASAKPAASAAPVASASSAPPAAPVTPFQPPAHPRMLPDFFLAALAKVDLKPEQTKEVQAIQQDLQKARETARAPHERLIADLADGVSSGKVDESKINMDIGALRDAVAATAPALQDAMNRLHKVLDAEQRKKVVAAFREKAKAAREAEGTGMGPALRAEHVKTLEEELAVSPEQQKTLDKKLDTQFKAQVSAMKDKLSVLGTQLNLLADSFAGDKFDAKGSGVGAYGADVIVVLAKHRLEFVKTLMSVLKPEQCKVLAKKIGARAGSPDDNVL